MPANATCAIVETHFTKKTWLKGVKRSANIRQSVFNLQSSFERSSPSLRLRKNIEQVKYITLRTYSLDMQHRIALVVDRREMCAWLLLLAAESIVNLTIKYIDIFEATITYMNRPPCSLGLQTKETNLVGLTERFPSMQIRWGHLVDALGPCEGTTSGPRAVRDS